MIKKKFKQINDDKFLFFFQIIYIGRAKKKLYHLYIDICHLVSICC